MLLYIRKNLQNKFWQHIFLVLILSVGIISLATTNHVINAAKIDIEQQLQEFGANIAIYPKSEQFHLNYGGINLGDFGVQARDFNESEKEKILNIHNKDEIRFVSPKLIGLGRLTNSDKIIVGTDFANELPMKKWWLLNGEVPQGNQILLGHEVAQELELKIHDKISIGDIKGENNQEFIVSGIINKTDTQDDNVIFMELAQAQDLFNKEGKVSFFEVTALCQACPIEEITEQLYHQFPDAKITTMKQLIEQQIASVARLSKLGMAVSIVIIFVSLITFTVSMISFVRDKVREIAVMKTVGYTNRDIALIIGGQSVVIALLVAFLASIITPFTSYYLAMKVLMLETSYDYSQILIILVMSVALSILSSIIPIKNAMKISVIEAFREV